VVLDADLMIDTGAVVFRDRFPDRFFECGIAEQDMVSQASGMALSGLLPVAHSFACFLTPRANEQMYNACSELKRVIYVGSLAGLVPAGPGHSHQSVRDIAVMGSLPGLVALEPCCEAEVGLAVDWCVEEAPQSSYLRLVSIPCEIPYSLPVGYRLRLGQGVALTQGEDLVLIGSGPVLLPQAVRVAERLRSQGVGVKVVNLPWLNRVDEAWLEEVVGNASWVFTLDNHLFQGGQGQLVAATLARGSRRPRLHHFCVEGMPECGSVDEILRHHGLDAESLYRVITAKLALAGAR
jgi:transketolase